MFCLSKTPLNPAELNQSLTNFACGACVTFEGWVRDHNEGRTVLRMEYEAYEAVAVREGVRIVEEHCSKVNAGQALCVHRVGCLMPGELAVWVGVVSPHRGEAFDACQKIINDIKHQVPIWKKEHYAEGDSGWVNCERCENNTSTNSSPAAPTPEAYYARQILLPEIGSMGQERLANTRVLVVGAGGLASGALPALAAAGFGVIGICDGDQVDASNLHRQTLFTPQDIGKSKASVAAARLRALNPLIKCYAHEFMLESFEAQQLIEGYDLLLDCSDNFGTKFLLNDCAVKQKKVLIQASIYQYEGQLFTYSPDDHVACMRCLWPEAPAPDCVGTCADVGVLGAVPAVFGAMQAMESIKNVLHLPDRLRGEILFVDLLSYRTRRVTLAKNPDCPACAAQSSNPGPLTSVNISLAPEHLDGYTVVDVRERDEAATAPLDGIPHLVWPISIWRNGSAPLAREQRYVLCCTHGRRSQLLAELLRQQGFDVYSLRGGLHTWFRGPC